MQISPKLLVRAVLLSVLVIAQLGPGEVVQARTGGIGPSASSCDPSRQSCAVDSSAPAPASCGPGSTGQPCGGAQVASQGSASPVNIGVGNPINLITGNKYQQETDLAALSGVLGLEIVRHYNSRFSGAAIPAGILGRGWKLSYETELHLYGPTVQIVQADGTRIIFNRDPLNPSQCASANPAHGSIRIQRSASAEQYLWSWNDGKKLSFNSQGKLVQIQAPSGEFVSLQHDARGQLLSVTDPQGRVMRLIYPERSDSAYATRFKGVIAIDTPVGRFKYDYGSELPVGSELGKIHLAANLVKVSYPTHYDSAHKLHAYSERGITSSAISRHYHYEDKRHPTLLSGISVSGSGSDGQLSHQRIATWGYDANARAVLSSHADGVNRVSLQYDKAGQTTLSNSLGQKTVYQHAIIGGEYRLVQALGPGCASCGQSNIRHSYDKLGRLTQSTELNAQGQSLRALQSELDHYGRPTRVRRIDYRNGKPGPAQLLARYEYPVQGNSPSLIARPSVVAGKEHHIRIAYNEAGQPTQI
ncbi:MAG: DUF6531 domain-containing protein, partial [Rhodoferax sp.]